MSLVIEIENIEIKRSNRLIFSDFSLRVEAGERVALTGPSGIGKSTLLMSIAGLLAPSQGRITIGAHRVVSPIASVTLMQQRPALLPWASALENVALGLRFSSGLSLLGRAGFGSFDKAIKEKARTLLEQVGLQGYESAKPFELSGGQQQRVALARALALKPSVLLLDEPFSQLDPVTRKQLRQDLRQLAEERNITVVLVTHDLEDAKELCHRSHDISPQHQSRCRMPIEEMTDSTSADNIEDLYAATGTY